MEPPESSPPQHLPEAGEGKEEVKEADELKLGVAKDTATETSDVESLMAAQRRLTEGDGELEVDEHQEGDRMTTESLFEQESDRENKYYAAKTLNVESSTVGNGRVTKVEGEKEENQDTRMAEAPGETNLVEDYGKEQVMKEADEEKLESAKDSANKTLDAKSSTVDQTRRSKDEGEIEQHHKAPGMARESDLRETDPVENYGKGKEKVEESDHELILNVAEDSAETLDAESSMAAQSRLTEGERRLERRSRFTVRSSNEETSSIIEEESAAMMSNTKSLPKLDRENINYKCALYRVHSKLRDGSDKHYEPVLVSIGPYHHGKPALKDMEKHKEHFRKVVLESVKENSKDRYVDALKNEKGEIEALHCYRDTFEMNDSLGECMVRDGFFLIELFRGTWRQDRRSDMLFNRRWMMPFLKRDLILYENQIPLFVLRALFALTVQGHNEHDLVKERVASTEERHDSDSKLVEQALGFFYFNNKPVPNLNPQPSQLDHIPHLLGLVYEALVVSSIRIDSEPKQQNGSWKSFLGFSMINIWSPFVRIMKAFWSPCVRVMRALCSPFVRVMKAFVRKTPERPNNSPKSWEPIWTAVALEQVGVQFRSANDRKAFYDICFRDGVLSIPPLAIYDSTESFFRNLVAYEQYSKYYTCQQVGNYLMVMDCLINSAKDVELLRHCGIIDNGLGDDEKVSTMFNHLCSGVCYVSECFVYAEMFNEVNKFCKKRTNVWIAKLKNEYFGSPWSVISFVAALLLLLLTAFQTGYSAASYYYQPKSQG